MSDLYLLDANRHRIHDGDRVYSFRWDDVTKMYGTLRKSEPDAFYPFCVEWDIGFKSYLPGVKPILEGGGRECYLT